MKLDMPDLKNVAVFAVLMTIVSFVIHTIEAIATMGYYTNPAYLQVWSKVMMPVAGPPPPEFTYLSLAFAFVTWVLFAMVYVKLGGLVSGKDKLNKLKQGLKFGLYAFMLAGIPGALSMYLLINLPPSLIVIWAFTGLVIDLIGGVAAAKTIPGAG